MATLIKTDKNGTKYYEGLIPCDRCSGTGTYIWGAMINGRPQYAGVCFKCDGLGKVHGKWKEYTPEYEQKLAERREKRNAKLRAEYEAEQRRIVEEEARIKAEKEARIKAEKMVSQYVGEVGEKIAIEGSFFNTAWYTSHVGWMEQTIYVHTFKDVNGNKFVWKTSSTSLPDFNYGEPVKVTGTIKEHSEYKEEKQTILTRCKVVNLAREVL